MMLLSSEVEDMTELTNLVHSLANKKNAVQEIIGKYAGTEPDIAWDASTRQGGQNSYFLDGCRSSLLGYIHGSGSGEPTSGATQSSNWERKSKESVVSAKKDVVRSRKSKHASRYEEHFGLSSMTVSDVKLLRRD